MSTRDEVCSSVHVCSQYKKVVDTRGEPGFLFFPHDGKNAVRCYTTAVPSQWSVRIGLANGLKFMPVASCAKRWVGEPPLFAAWIMRGVADMDGRLKVDRTVPSWAT